MPLDNKLKLVPFLFFDDRHRSHDCRKMPESVTFKTWILPPKKRRLNSPCFSDSAVNNVGPRPSQEILRSNDDQSRFKKRITNNSSSFDDRDSSKKPHIDLESLTYYPAEDYGSGDDCVVSFEKSPKAEGSESDEEYLPSGRSSQRIIIRRSRKQRKYGKTKKTYISIMWEWFSTVFSSYAPSTDVICGS